MGVVGTVLSAVVFGVLTTALVGSIGGSREIGLADLREMELPYRFFADELRLAAIERIQHRLRTTMEEVVLQLLAAPPGLERWPLLVQLRLFPPDDAWHAFEQLADGTIKACWIICTNPVATIANRKTVIAGLDRHERFERSIEKAPMHRFRCGIEAMVRHVCPRKSAL